MKFLLDFVTCYTRCRSSSETTPSADDTLFLVPTLPPAIPSLNRHYRSGNKRWRTNRSNSCSVADWRPSLNAISEDSAAVVVNRTASAGSEIILKRKVSPATKSHGRNRRSSDHYGRDPIQAIMPAFSPTPFMF